MSRLFLHLDCRYYRGDKPCKYKRLCEGCPEYSPMGKRILIIKLAAIGDVLRTTPVLSALRKKYSPCHITWVTESKSAELLKDNDSIDRLLILENPDTVSGLLNEQFDVLACLDKEPRATGLTMKIQAKEKIGFGLSEYGTPCPLSESSDYAFQLGLDDELKFRKNQKTYPEIIFDIFQLPYSKQSYYVPFPKSVYEKSKELVKKWKLGVGKSASLHSRRREEFTIGLNTGSGTRFATKQWTIEGFVGLAHLIQKKYGKFAKILILGGPEEKQRNKEIIRKCKSKKIPVIDTGCENSLLDFCSILNLCDIVVTSDSLALHLAIALKKQIIVFFGSTCAQEIELYGRGEKIVIDPAQFPCSPCYLAQCNQPVFCMNTLPSENVFKKLQKITNKL